MKKISVIIPFYPVDQDKHKVLKECVQNLPEVYEKIIVWNRREGYAKAINEGAMCASGDYLLIMNDDVRYESGDVQKLCEENTVISPAYNKRTYENIWGSCFCVPREVWGKIGGMDERYDISYFDDDDLIFTLKKHGYKMKPEASVVFDHPNPGRTLESMPDRNEFFEANKQKFKEKWGRLP